MSTFIRDLLGRRRFACPSGAPNFPIVYTRRACSHQIRVRGGTGWAGTFSVCCYTMYTMSVWRILDMTSLHRLNHLLENTDSVEELRMKPNHSNNIYSQIPRLPRHTGEAEAEGMVLSCALACLCWDFIWVVLLMYEYDMSCDMSLIWVEICDFKFDMGCDMRYLLSNMDII